jgi:hypothetical protein
VRPRCRPTAARCAGCAAVVARDHMFG